MALSSAINASVDLNTWVDGLGETTTKAHDTSREERSATIVAAARRELRYRYAPGKRQALGYRNPLQEGTANLSITHSPMSRMHINLVMAGQH